MTNLNDTIYFYLIISQKILQDKYIKLFKIKIRTGVVRLQSILELD